MASADHAPASALRYLYLSGMAKIMKVGRRQKRMQPVAPLDAFLRTDPSRKDWD